MTSILLSIFYFLFFTLLFHPLFVALIAIILISVICNHMIDNDGKPLPHVTRHVDAIDILWLKNSSSPNDFCLVWCDPSVHTDDNQHVTQQLLRKIDPNLVLISDVSICEETLKKLHREHLKTIFLILAGSIAEEILTHIASDTYTVFIFCFDKTKYTDLATQTKVDSISDSPSQLVERINDVLSSIERRFAYEHEQQSLRNLCQETAAFLWFHLFRNVIRHTDKSHKAKDDMMIRFREYYQNNTAQLDRLTELAENYDPDHALWWYTQPSFISDVINKAIRARDIDTLFDLRYCIADLCQLLEEQPRPTTQITVYRGVLMDLDKFHKMQEIIGLDDLISMRGFLSTSLKRDKARHFGSNDANDPQKVEIIYEIDVPLGLQNIICANISGFSMFSDEEEILFDLDSTFELKEILEDPTKNNCWIIRLTASDRGGQLAAKHLEYNNHELNHISPDVLFGKLLIDMGDADKGLKYFERLLMNLDNQEQDDNPLQTRINRGIVMNQIGRAWHAKGAFTHALKWYDSALNLQRQEPELTYHASCSINNKGVFFMMNGQWSEALTAFEQAAETMARYNSYEDLASVLSNMGIIKDQLGEYETALDLFRRVEEILQATGTHDTHHDVANNKMKIAFVYINQARWQEALDTLNKVKKMREEILPATHPDMGRTLFTIGIVLRSQQRFDEALEYMTRGLAVYKRSLMPGHPHIADAYNSIANLKSVQNQLGEALALYEQAYEQFRKFYDTDEHCNIARVFNNMGQVYRRMGQLSQAFEYLNKALYLRQITVGIQHPDTATTWVNLGLVHRAQGNLNVALEHVRHGWTIRQKTLPPENEDLLATKELIDQLEQEIAVFTHQ